MARWACVDAITAKKYLNNGGVYYWDDNGTRRRVTSEEEIHQRWYRKHLGLWIRSDWKVGDLYWFPSSPHKITGVILSVGHDGDVCQIYTVYLVAETDSSGKITIQRYNNTIEGAVHINKDSVCSVLPRRYSCWKDRTLMNKADEYAYNLGRYEAKLHELRSILSDTGSDGEDMWVEQKVMQANEVTVKVVKPLDITSGYYHHVAPRVTYLF